jgi:hypothetical protein
MSDINQPKKRGRKPKNILENVENNIEKNKVIKPKKVENESIKNEIIEPKPKRKYTKRKNKDTETLIEQQKNKTENKTENVVIQDENNVQPENVKQPKKRGRKPKGGKIIVPDINNELNVDLIKPNVILHLKCSSNDLDNSFELGNLNYNPIVENVCPYNENEMDNYNKLEYNIEVSVNKTLQYEDTSTTKQNNYTNNTSIDMGNLNDKLIHDKLKQLQTMLHYDDISDKQSDCFSCGHSFNTPTIYIPKHILDGKYKVYGCFCLPECACRHLFNENIDTSVKWERYALLNNVYGKIYNYTKPIKPAPSPHYLLNNYYGNMTIEEYRHMLHQDKLIIVVDKPLSRVLPEIHDENNELPSFNFNKSNNKGNKNTTSNQKKNIN